MEKKRQKNKNKLKRIQEKVDTKLDQVDQEGIRQI